MRTILIAFFSLLCFEVPAQEFSILRTIDNCIKYSDSEGNWLTELQWTEKYGRKAFRKAFPKPYRADHVEETNYTRWNIEEAFSTDFDIQWSRVFTSDIDEDELIKAAYDILENPVIDGNKVSGRLADRGFTDTPQSTWSVEKYAWSANVLYEFRDGRYKVTLSDIKVQRTSTVDAHIFNFTVKDRNPKLALRDILYDGFDKLNCFYSYTNNIDYSFCIATYIIIQRPDDDW